MPRQKGSKSQSEQKVRKILSDIFRRRPDQDLTKSDVVGLVMQSRRVPQEWMEAIHERAVSNEIGRILRSEKFSTEHGAELRVYQSYKAFVQVDGKEVQKQFWRDIHTMNRRQMTACLRARGALAKDILKQAEATRAYWNNYVAPTTGEKPIQKRLFNKD